MGMEYKISSYIDTVKNLHIRNIITRLRLNQAKLRGVRKGETSVLCDTCDLREDVKHFLLYCNKRELMLEREKYFRKIDNFVPNFRNFCDLDKIKEILNLNFSCSALNQSVAIDIT